MFVIVPQTITEAVLTASAIPETDYAAWSSATAYTVGQRVILTTGYHKIYECVSANTNKHPGTDPARLTYWLEVGSTNRWRPFDGKISDPASYAGTITMTLAPTQICDSLAFFGLSASSVTVVVKSGSTVVSTSSVSLIDRTDATDWFSWFFDEIRYDTEALILTFSASLGNTIEITIAGAGTVEVGEIVLGRNRQLGTPLLGTEPGIRDYSRKERDDFGNPILVERAFASTVDYKFSFPSADARRVNRTLAEVRATPCVFHTGAQNTGFGTTIYGFLTDLSTPITHRQLSFSSLKVEGLV